MSRGAIGRLTSEDLLSEYRGPVDQVYFYSGY